jgi:hypothetical protein
VTSGNPQSDCSIRGLENSITLLGKEPLGQAPDSGFILDQENRLGDPRTLLCNRGRFRSSSRSGFFLKGRFGESRIERLEPRRREQLSGKD